MKNSGVFVVLVMTFMTCPAGIAAEHAEPVPATQPAVVSLGDKKSLDSNIGKDVVVEGLVSEAAWSASGKVFLIKFTEGETTQFQGVLFLKSREAMEKAFNDDLSNAFVGAKIRLAGKLQTYRDHPEILIGDPKQITTITKGPGNSPHAEPSTRAS